MSDHIFVRMHARNQLDDNITDFFACKDVEEAEKIAQNWLIRKCGMECYHKGTEEQNLIEKSGGQLPELSFCCPSIKKSADLEQYNGFYFFQGIGSVSLFLNVIYDTETAHQFGKSVIAEFDLDKIYSDEADELIDMLKILERSFQEKIDYSEAQSRIRTLILGGGLLPL